VSPYLYHSVTGVTGQDQQHDLRNSRYINWKLSSESEMVLFVRIMSVMPMLLGAVMIIMATVRSQAIIMNQCTCVEQGLYYSPISDEDCTKFVSYSDEEEMTVQSCPPYTLFDVSMCVCNHQVVVTCPADCHIANTSDVGSATNSKALVTPEDMTNMETNTRTS